MPTPDNNPNHDTARLARMAEAWIQTPDEKDTGAEIDALIWFGKCGLIALFVTWLLVLVLPKALDLIRAPFVGGGF